MATENLKKTAPVPQEPTYTVQELAAAAEAFGTRPEVVSAALKLRNITKTTKKNAEEIVKAFLKREVK